MKRLILGVSVLFLAISCKDVDQCGSTPNSQYHITAIEVTPVTYSELPTLIGFKVTTTAVDTNNAVDANQFMLELNADTAINPTLVKNSPDNGYNFSFSFSFSLMSKAYACSPVAPYTEEKITQLNITSDNDFSADYPAGSNLNALFNVLYSESVVVPTHTNSNGDRTAYTLAEYVATTPNASQILQLKLIQAPETLKTHQFTIDYMHDDGQQFTVSTGVVTFE
ncbi:MAG: hypothetical protein HRT35_01035 [Algicola sp.]|nr:hypothetical protein [Algicola sp.]